LGKSGIGVGERCAVQKGAAAFDGRTIGWTGRVLPQGASRADGGDQVRRGSVVGYQIVQAGP
jgi:hypothetical protein